MRSVRALLLVLFTMLCAVSVAPEAADAQGCGPTNPNCIVPTAPAGTSDNRAASTAFVQGAVSLNNVTIPVTASRPIAPTDCRATLDLNGGFFSLTVPSTSGFSSNCALSIYDGDTGRGKAITGLSGTGCSSSSLIWPGQTCIVGIVNGAWVVLSRPGRWRPPQGTTLNFYSDFTNGTDTAGATDGLATGAAAFKTAEHCFLNATDQLDFASIGQTQLLCNMAAATADTIGMHAPVHALTGADGGAAIQIVGASLAVSSAVSNGGACKITVPSTSTYTANEVVAVYGIGGATGCNGTWKVTVTDITHLTLQSTTFGGAYTSGGTVTNGSSFNVTGDAGVGCYFGTVIQFQNIAFASSSSGLAPTDGCKVYLNYGNIFGAAAVGINVSSGGQVYVNGDQGISASMTDSFVLGDMAGVFYSLGSFNINFLPGVNPSFSGDAFAYAGHGSQLNFTNLTVNLNSNTVTGTRCTGTTGGVVDSGTGTPNSYFPGNSNCTTSLGGQAN